MNVQDKYKSWIPELIREDLQKKSWPFAMCMEHWDGDFNLGTAVRNANAFGAQETFYLGGKKRWDRRSAVGTHNYTDLSFLKEREDLLALKEKYPVFIGVDNVPGAKSIVGFKFPKNCLLIFGEEGNGLTQETISMCDELVEIPMCGSVRSLNAGTSTGIIMYQMFIQFQEELNASTITEG